MGLAPGRGDRAALGTAAAVADSHGLALSRGEQAAAAAEVEHLAAAPEHHGDDLSGARQPPRLGGADRLLPDQTDAGQLRGQGLEVHGDQHGRRVATVQRHPARVGVLQERRERLPEPPPRHRSVGLDPVSYAGTPAR
jgi:hypothetical protein